MVSSLQPAKVMKTRVFCISLQGEAHYFLADFFVAEAREFASREANDLYQSIENANCISRLYSISLLLVLFDRSNWMEN